MTTTVLHGWFVNIVTQRVIQEYVEGGRQCRHVQFDHLCGYYKWIKYHDIQLCHTVIM